MKDELVEVTQADRDAAAEEYWRTNQGVMDVIGCALKAGAGDHNPLVQKAARHRIAALRETRDEG